MLGVDGMGRWISRHGSADALPREKEAAEPFPAQRVKWLGARVRDLQN